MWLFSKAKLNFLCVVMLKKSFVALLCCVSLTHSAQGVYYDSLYEHPIYRNTDEIYVRWFVSQLPETAQANAKEILKTLTPMNQRDLAFHCAALMPPHQESRPEHFTSMIKSLALMTYEARELLQTQLNTYGLVPLGTHSERLSDVWQPLSYIWHPLGDGYSGKIEKNILEALFFHINRLGASKDNLHCFVEILSQFAPEKCPHLTRPIVDQIFELLELSCQNQENFRLRQHDKFRLLIAVRNVKTEELAERVRVALGAARNNPDIPLESLCEILEESRDDFYNRLERRRNRERALYKGGAWVHADFRGRSDH